MNDSSVLLYILQTAGALILLMTSGIASWALKEVYRLSRDYEGLRARVESEAQQTLRELQRLQAWMNSIDEKLTELLKCGRGEGRRHEHTG